MTDVTLSPWQKQAPLPREVLAAQARLLHEQVPQSLRGGFGVAVIISALISTQVPLSLLLGWWFFYLLTFAFRLGSYQRFKANLYDEDRAVAWAKFSVFPLLLGGLYWGLTAAFAIYNSNLIVTAITIAVMAGLSSGAAGALSAIHYCYLAYAIPMTLPSILVLLYIGSFETYSLALLTAIFMLANAIFARNIYRGMTTMILTRLENESLIQTMKEQQQKLELKTAEAERSTEIAFEANRAKSVFLASASHDLAQPLHSLRLFLIALRDEIDADNQKVLIAKALQCGDSLSELFMALLDISKLDAGDIVVNKHVFDIADVIDSLAEEFAVQAGASNVRFEASNLSCVVESDATILQRIIRNLLSNAFKYSNSSCVKLDCKMDGEFVVIEVADSGIGIPKDQLASVFKEFYQVGNVERDRSKGLGLGLAIVERLSGLLGVTVDIASELGKGTTVSITLPVSESLIGKVSGSQASVVSSVGHEHHVVVFIDDERETREAMQQVFKRSGFTLYVAEDVETAQNILAEHNAVPDLIISDYRLQGGATGVEGILQLREEFNRDIAGLIISGDSQLSSLKDIVDNQIDFLHKLAPHHELEQTIHKLLE